VPEPLRIALVGCGRICRKHLEVIAALPELRLVGVCDLIAERAERAAATGGAPAYLDAVEMVEREQPDIVAVLAESGAHARLGLALAPRVRTLIIEKPLALTLESTDALIEACEHHRTRLFVVKQNRYNPPVVRLRAALEAGRFGKLALGTVRVRWCRTQEYYDQDAWRGTWRDDGGVFANQASHHIDLLQWMMGPVESVQAYTATRLVDIETEDTGVAVLRFTSGALGVVEATTATRPTDLEGSLSLLGEKGSVVLGGFAVNRVETWQFATPLPEDAEVAAASTAPPDVYGYGHYGFYRDVLDCIWSGRRAMLDGLAGRRTLELITALYEAAATGREVRLQYTPRAVRLGR
jgi:UDP-N-acetyl-2-amino-2-deoxyglucuronate dehydrogenase